MEDYDLIDEKKPPPLPLVFMNPNICVTLAPCPSKPQALSSLLFPFRSTLSTSQNVLK